MPYIRQEHRSRVLNTGPENPGELNYFITHCVWSYLKQRGRTYANFNEVMGVLECVKLELYRRKIADYEDEKKTVNGDVYY